MKKTRLLFSIVLLASALPAHAEDAKRDLLGDSLPRGALARMGSIRLRSDNTVTCVAFTRDGKTLVTAGYTNKVAFWDVKTGKRTREVTVVPSSIYSLEVIGDGKTLAISGNDGATRILDTATGAEKKVLQDSMRRYGNVTCAFSPDGKTAVMMGRYDRQVLIWDVEKGTVKHRATGINTYNPPPVAFTSDSKQFITVWTDGKLHLIDVATGKSIRNLEPASTVAARSVYNIRIPMLALTPDNKHLVYRLSSSRFFEVMEVSTGKIVKRIEKTAGYAYYSQGAIAITPNGRFLVEASGDSAVRIWGLASGKLLRELSVPSGSISRLALSHDGKLVASVRNNAIYLWDVPAAKQLHDAPGHQSAVGRLIFTPDGKRLVSIGSSTIRIWEAATGKEESVSQAYGLFGISHLGMTANGKALQYVGSDRALYQWPLDAAGPNPLTAPKYAPYFTAQAVSPDAKVLAAINATDRKLRLIDQVGGKPDRELTLVSNAYGNVLTFSPDGRTLVLAAADRSVTYFDVPSADRFATGSGEATPGVWYANAMIVFSGDSRSLLQFDGELKVIETVSGGERIRLPRELSGAPNQLAWSADGRLVARGNSDGTVIVFDTYAGREILRCNGGQGVISSLAFSQDGRKLAAGGANTTILVWSVPRPETPARAAGLDDAGAWRDLEDLDAGRAFRAMTHLVAAPVETIKLFKSRFKPRPPVDAKRINQLIVDLDNDTYRVREKAAQDLAELGTAAEEALSRATRSASLEVKRRAEDLLSKLKGSGLAPDRLRAQRAVEVLEKIGTPAARKMLETLLDKTKLRLDPALEEAIKASIARLAQRGVH